MILTILIIIKGERKEMSTVLYSTHFFSLFISCFDVIKFTSLAILFI